MSVDNKGAQAAASCKTPQQEMEEVLARYNQAHKQWEEAQRKSAEAMDKMLKIGQIIAQKSILSKCPVYSAYPQKSD